MTKPLIFEMSAEARLLLTHLRDAEVGQFFSYADLGLLVSRDINSGASALQTALRHLQSDHQMAFAAIRGEGIRRLSDIEIIDDGSARLGRIRRASKRAFARMNTVEFSKLSREHQAKFSAETAIMATIAHMSGAAQVRKIEKAAQSDGRRELPIAETLRMFSK